MKKSILLLITIITLTSNGFSQDQLRVMESMTMKSRILKQDVHFSVCLPRSYYIDKQSFPVVYLLHGLGDDETSWLEYGRISQNADQAVAEKKAVPMIFVMPDGFRSYYVNDYQGNFLYQDMFVKELVPHIDSLFRTIPDSRHRALMGYSMGGYGALTLHLKYPDIFGSTVPLSISIRTDEQYMTEDPSEWEQQWGRLFGGQSLTGPGRLTDYYKMNCPFYQLKDFPPADYGKLKIYIDNGDKEQTLCRSNEELHILMRSLGIPHEFRVRDGGHSFGYWLSALPGGLHFISSVFEAKPYAMESVPVSRRPAVPDNQFINLNNNDEAVPVCLPEEYARTSRRYPVVYLAGNLSAAQQKSIAALVNGRVRSNLMGPVILVYLKNDDIPGLPSLVPLFEDRLRIRKGPRFRALLSYQGHPSLNWSDAFNRIQFTACILSDTNPDKKDFPGLLDQVNADALKRISFYIEAPDKGAYYEGNGQAHILLRDREMYHEYRVRGGEGGFDWFMAGLPAILEFANMRFHK
jgi:enterochelin esterase-like enzyme